MANKPMSHVAQPDSSRENAAEMNATARMMTAPPPDEAREHPIFIVGAARSGTSLLSRLLNSHPRIAVPFESHIYSTFLPWLKHYGDLSRPGHMERLLDDILSTEMLRHWSPQPDRAATLASLKGNTLHDLVEALFATWARAQGKDRWGEKTPSHVMYWRQLLEGFPQARFLHIVRDGRDVSLSWINARFGPKNIYYSAIRWKQYLTWVAELRAALPAHQFLDVHYDSLLAEPEGTLQRICAFLGESFDADMLDFHRDPAPYPTDAHNVQALERPIQRNNTEKWKGALSRDEIRVFEATAGSTLRQYGYEISTPDLAIHLSEHLRYRTMHTPQRLLAMLRNRQGHREYLRWAAIYLGLRLRAPGSDW